MNLYDAQGRIRPGRSQFNISVNQAQRTYATTDLFAYLEFAKNEMGWQSSNTDISLSLLEFFHKYCSLQPDMVGKNLSCMDTVQRIYIAELAGSRSEGYFLDKEIVEQIFNTLVNGFGSLDYKIDANEARKLGLNIMPYDSALEPAVNHLYKTLANHLKLNEPFVPQGQGKEVTVLVETSARRAAKYAVVKGINNTPKGPVADIGISPWKFT